MHPFDPEELYTGSQEDTMGELSSGGDGYVCITSSVKNSTISDISISQILKCKDAIVDRMSEKFGRRLLIQAR